MQEKLWDMYLIPKVYNPCLVPMFILMVQH